MSSLKTYEKFLIDILNNQEKIDYESNKSLFKINIYLSLLSLNNHNYNENTLKKEHDLIDNFLRKINNLKVKIQLKRKEQEIDNLINEIKEIYQKNSNIINKYNFFKLEINSYIDSKDPKKITILIDKLTKEKLRKNNHFEEYNYKIKEISNIIFDGNYYLENDILYIIGSDRCLKLTIDEFYEMFEYLLEIDNYKETFLNDKYNQEHKLIINSLINIIEKDTYKDLSLKEIIPIIMTYLLTKNLSSSDINTSNFQIDNIKITDLYSFANNKEIDQNNHAKWNKIIIPNEYLYQKINELTQKGMYYYQDNLFTIENIEGKISDFKVSISLDKITEFLYTALSS